MVFVVCVQFVCCYLQCVYDVVVEYMVCDWFVGCVVECEVQVGCVGVVGVFVVCEIDVDECVGCEWVCGFFECFVDYGVGQCFVGFEMIGWLVDVQVC